MCCLTVIEKFTVPGEHREAFGFNKKSFKTMRLRASPPPSGTLLSGRGEPAAATAARRHHYLRSQAPTHPNQASEPRRPSFAGRKHILRRRSNIIGRGGLPKPSIRTQKTIVRRPQTNVAPAVQYNWKRGSKEKEDAKLKGTALEELPEDRGLVCKYQTGHSGAKNIVAHNKGCTELKG